MCVYVPAIQVVYTYVPQVEDHHILSVLQPGFKARSGTISWFVEQGLVQLSKSLDLSKGCQHQLLQGESFFSVGLQ